MEELIEALQIFLKYGNPTFPIICEHEVLHINGIYPENVSDEDKNKLRKLGFISGTPYGYASFYSYKYGSA